ncbi:hypothetical protein [Streptomyces sp. NPDC055058]
MPAFKDVGDLEDVRRTHAAVNVVHVAPGRFVSARLSARIADEGKPEQLILRVRRRLHTAAHNPVRKF